MGGWFKGQLGSDLNSLIHTGQVFSNWENLSLESKFHMNINNMVSTIIPAYNRSNTIIRTLDSVKKQSYRPIELIVVDDGSIDDTKKIVEQWIEINSEKCFFVYCISQNNKGAPAARNMGLSAAKGRFIQFLDSDDILYPEKFSMQVDSLIKNNAGISICNFRYVLPDNQFSTIKNNGNLKWRMAIGWSVFTASPIMDRNNLQVDSWDPQLKINQDVDYFLKNIIAAKKVVHLDSVLCDYVIHNGSRISDFYTIKKPQFLRRALNIFRYQFKILKTSPMSLGYGFVAFVYLIRSELRYYVIFLLKKLGFSKKLFSRKKS